MKHYQIHALLPCGAGATRHMATLPTMEQASNYALSLRRTNPDVEFVIRPVRRPLP